MKSHLFYTFLVIFAATAIVTLLGVTSVITIREGYLTALVSAFLIELGGAIIAIFKSADFFASEKKQLSAEENIWTSIRKLDDAFGYLDDRMKAQMIHFQSSFLRVTPTPRTDIMVLRTQIEKNVGKIHHDVIEEGLGAIADVLEKNIHISSVEKAALVSLCKSLPNELAGAGSRILDAINKDA